MDIQEQYEKLLNEANELCKDMCDIYDRLVNLSGEINELKESITNTLKEDCDERT